MTDNLLYLMFAHVLWVFLLYGALTVVRAPSAWGIGSNSRASRLFSDIEPRVSANLRNQFEWPLFFHVACILAIMDGAASEFVMTAVGIVFILGRLLHSLVQIFTTNIRLRGVVFTINFLAVMVMWVSLIVSR